MVETNKNDLRKTRNGESTTRLCRIWAYMKARCSSPKNKDYKYYGAKGVKVCEDWNDYDTFKKWALDNGYQENLTIDRIDTNGNYEPSNCRWTTRKVQANNTTRNHYVTHNGVTKTISEWAEELKVSQRTIYYRIQNGLTDEEAIFTIDRRRKVMQKI